MVIRNYNQKKRIVVGLSGGVDSAVSAYLLKQQGYEVIGVFMQNWDEYVNHDFLGHVGTHKQQCNAQKDFSDVKKIAEVLQIKVYRINYIKEFWDKVFKYLIKTYQHGQTPNPDVLCNKYIKFKLFLDYAKKKFGCDLIAMGHYANVIKRKNEVYLAKAKDLDKDQTYFLCWLTKKQLTRTIFPLGNILKTKVRQIAKAADLSVWKKKDSTGVCFIGERKFKLFLQNYIKPKKGKIIDIDSNKCIGIHEGIMFYTIGQNKNLNLGGQNQRYFVCKKDTKKNLLYVCNQKTRNIHLISTSCVVKRFNWINAMPKKKSIMVRFRHRQKLIKGSFLIRNNLVYLQYQPTLAVTIGQFAVLYDREICLGGGIVDKIC